MDEDARREMQRMITEKVDKKWNDHKKEVRPWLIGSFIGTYLAGFGSGAAFMSYWIGPR